MQHIAHQIHDCIVRARRVVVIPHQNPDGDALGSATALLEYLRALNKPAHLFCATTANEKLGFLPHAGRLTSNPNELTNPEVDVIILVDSGDLRYAGVADLLLNHQAKIINIDHHPTNERYGHLNLVIPTAASTTEILYHYFVANHFPLNHHMATSLLTGLITDTGNFSNAATSTVALKVGGELLRAGGNLKLIHEHTFKNKTLNSLKLWGAALSRLVANEAEDITSTYITMADMQAFAAKEYEVEGIANFLNNLSGTKIALVLKELPDGNVKGSFRTTDNYTDVSALAKALGGGGHKKAAGFTTAGPIAAALERILALKRESDTLNKK